MSSSATGGGGDVAFASTPQSEKLNNIWTLEKGCPWTFLETKRGEEWREKRK